MRTRIVGILGMSLLALSGCQNMCGGGYPMQSMTRVPPPGTGSYPMPGAYYNNTMGAQSAVSPAIQPAAGLANAEYLSTTPSADVAAAQFTVPAQAASSYPAPLLNNTLPDGSSYPVDTPPVVRANFSDNAPNLQWQR
ncbi:MAG: hypothetical protein KF752_12835 [Pirellulaceae bacterium]|nr:hypothetical protein [Pirellulaceae bacterium]